MDYDDQITQVIYSAEVEDDTYTIGYAIGAGHFSAKAMFEEVSSMLDSLNRERADHYIGKAISLITPETLSLKTVILEAVPEDVEAITTAISADTYGQVTSTTMSPLTFKCRNLLCLLRLPQ